MRKIFFSVVIVLFSLNVGYSQLLWKVTGKNLQKPSYLFGSHHLIPISFLDSVPGLYKAFNESDVVVGEIVFNNIDVASQIQQTGLLPEGTSMKDLLSTEDYQLVDDELKLMFKIGLQEVGMLHPALIKSMYVVEVFKKYTGFSDDQQSDSYFQLIAVQKNKKVVGLESLETQINILLGGDDLKRQAELLVASVRQKEEMISQMVVLNNLYKQGKINDLVQLAKKQDDVTDLTDEEYYKLNDERNFNWLEQLPDIMEESSSFIVVGALHLGGENGLVNQLKKAGYKVKPVTEKSK